MTLQTRILACLLAALPLAGADAVILKLDKSPHAKLRNVPVSAVTIKDGFWSARRKVNVERSIPTLLQLLEDHGILDNYRRLSGAKNVARRGPLYTDSDLYKWMEAVAFVLQSGRDSKLESMFDRITDEIVATQEPSGYLNTYYQDDRKSKRFTEMDRGHELYCLGHMIQAGIAYERATGKRKLLEAGMKFADYLARDFGPGKHPLLAGHPEIELALTELYRSTGDKKYLDLAGYILRGDGARLKLTQTQMGYLFSGKPFTDRQFIEGHAVRAGYACAGATDYYMETGDRAYWATLERLWTDMVTKKMYVTGGTGSRAAGETFGDDHELPNAKAYTESCAAIANMIWNWRMLAATGDAKYADVIELALYNSINSGMSLEGTLYCYRNPLELTKDAASKIRNPWYETTCCPPNLERTFAALPGYFYSTSKDGLYVHLYDASTMKWKLEDGSPIAVSQATKYPWEGTVTLTVSPAEAKEFTLFLRIPEWSAATKVEVAGKPLATPTKPGHYLPVKRTWKPGDAVRVTFDMRPQVITSHPRVMDNQGRVAVKRGPIVYALEQTDQPEDVPVLEVGFKFGQNPSASFTSEYRNDLLGGVVVLKHRGVRATKPLASLPLYKPFEWADKNTGPAVDLLLIPYYAFLNRGPAAIQVWTEYFR